MHALTQLILAKPHLAWYVKDKQNLSPESMLEHILNYGNWDDYILAERALGIHSTEAIFEKLKTKKRVNLRPQTISYFERYFEKYA